MVDIIMSATYEVDLREVNEIVECIVCRDVPTPPIYQCPSGHVICSACITKLTTPKNKCPVCRVTLPRVKIRCLAMEQLIGNLVRACEHKDSGCGAKVKLSNYQQHLEICEYSGFQYCKLLGSKCEAKTRLDNFVDHVNRMHTPTIIKNEPTTTKGVVYLTIPEEMLSRQTSIVSWWEPAHLLISPSNSLITLCVKTDIDTDGVIASYVFVRFTPTATLGFDKIHLRLERRDKRSGTEWFGEPLDIQDLKKLHENLLPLKEPEYNLLRSNFYKGSVKELKNTITLNVSFSKDNTSKGGLDEDSNGQGSFEVFMDGRFKGNSRLEKFTGVSCDSCNLDPLIGIRFSCLECENYDLCGSCANKGVHPQHLFLIERDTVERRLPMYSSEAAAKFFWNPDPEPETPTPMPLPDAVRDDLDNVKVFMDV